MLALADGSEPAPAPSSGVESKDNGGGSTTPVVEEEDNGSADANGTAGGAANGSATSGIAEAALIKAHRDQIHEMMDIVKAVRSPRVECRSRSVVLMLWCLRRR